MKKKKIIILLFLLLLFITGFVFRNKIKDILIPIYKVEDRTSNLKKINKKYKKVKNVGWLKVQGTNIDYPIILNNSIDEDTERDYDYLWVNSYITKNVNYIPVFGHNIRNVSSNPIIGDNDMTRFEQLMSFIYYDFAKENKYIQLTIDGKNYLYQIFAVSFDDKKNAKYISLELSNKKIDEYINKTLHNSLYKYNVDVNNNDKILTLITCTRFDGKLSRNFKIDAKLVKNKNIGYNYGIQKGKKYQEIEKILKGDGENV